MYNHNKLTCSTLGVRNSVILANFNNLALSRANVGLRKTNHLVVQVINSISVSKHRVANQRGQALKLLREGEQAYAIPVVGLGAKHLLVSKLLTWAEDVSHYVFTAEVNGLAVKLESESGVGIFLGQSTVDISILLEIRSGVNEAKGPKFFEKRLNHFLGQGTLRGAIVKNDGFGSIGAGQAVNALDFETLKLHGVFNNLGGPAGWDQLDANQGVVVALSVHASESKCSVSVGCVAKRQTEDSSVDGAAVGKGVDYSVIDHGVLANVSDGQVETEAHDTVGNLAHVGSSKSCILESDAANGYCVGNVGAIYGLAGTIRDLEWQVVVIERARDIESLERLGFVQVNYQPRISILVKIKLRTQSLTWRGTCEIAVLVIVADSALDSNSPCVAATRVNGNRNLLRRRSNIQVHKVAEASISQLRGGDPIAATSKALRWLSMLPTQVQGQGARGSSGCQSSAKNNGLHYATVLSKVLVLLFVETFSSSRQVNQDNAQR